MSMSEYVASEERVVTPGGRKNPGTARPIVLTTAGHYLPGYKAGGIITCVANIVQHLSSVFDFRIITRDYDLGDPEPYKDVKVCSWNKVGSASVYYLDRRSDSLSGIASLIEQTPHHALYLNSFFDPITVKVLCNRFVRRIGPKPIVLCPQGEFAIPSLRQKRLKKAMFIAFVRASGLYSPVLWHASSVAEAEDIRRVMGVPEARIHLASQLPPAMPSWNELAENQRDGVAGNELRVVFISRISPEKGLDFALQVLSRVRGKVHFDIIGPIEKVEYWKRCEQLLNGMPSNVKVRKLDPIKSSEVITHLANYDLLLFPSRSESYGQVIAESLVSGTQVLIGTGTPWRNLQEEGLGWDLPLEDMDAFVAVVDRLANSPRAERHARRSEVRKNFSAYFSKSSAIKDIKALFERAISNNFASK